MLNYQSVPALLRDTELHENDQTSKLLPEHTLNTQRTRTATPWNTVPKAVSCLRAESHTQLAIFLLSTV